MNRRQFLQRTSLAAAAALGGVRCGPGAALSSTAAPLAPPDGRTWFLAGQNADAVGGFGGDGWLDHVAEPPDGVTFYGSFPDVAGDTSIRAWADPVQAAMALPALQDAVLHLSLQWVNEGQDPAARQASQQAVLDGEHDAYIDAVGAWLAAYGRPVLLRLGYEFDRPPDYYDPALYAPCFRRIVLRLRDAGVTNAAFVWASANLVPLKSPDPDGWDFDTWYPGDDVVDWFGYSQWFPEDVDTVMLTQARARHKPVILAETSPVEWDLGNLRHQPLFASQGTDVTARELWDGWFAKMIASIEANRDVIRAWHYIAVDWRSDPLWQDVVLFENSDARPWANPEILDLLRDALRADPFVET